jgi:hypothetical protein
MDYRYSAELRQSRITFRKTLAGRVGSADSPNIEDADADD